MESDVVWWDGFWRGIAASWFWVWLFLFGWWLRGFFVRALAFRLRREAIEQTVHIVAKRGALVDPDEIDRRLQNAESPIPPPEVQAWADEVVQEWADDLPNVYRFPERKDD